MTAFHTPKTWAALYEVTAADLNLEIRDLFNAGWVGTAQGDMDYYSSATVKTRIPKGTAWEGLAMKSDGSQPEWQNTPQRVMEGTGDLLISTAAHVIDNLGIGAVGKVLSPSSGIPAWLSLATLTAPARMYASSSSNLFNNSWQVVNFQSDTYDPLNCTTNGASAKYTAPFTGYYQVNAVVALANATLDVGERFQVALYIDGADDPQYMGNTYYAHETETHTDISLSISDIVYLEAGHYVDIRAYQNSGGTLEISSDFTHCSFVRVG